MARPLRIEFAGAIYHVMSRGNNRAAVFIDDPDKRTFLRRLDRISQRLEWRILAYCLMSNHYHLVLETPEPTLARGMRELNSAYAQHFNRKHEQVGHLFQGRYRAIVVERGSYMLELIRYVVLNPVRAGLCTNPGEWPWSSHRAVLGQQTGLPTLDCRRVLGPFGTRVANARIAYEQFIFAGIALPPPAPHGAEVVGSTVSGTPDFATRVLERSDEPSPEIPRGQRITRQLGQYEAASNGRDEAIRAAHASGHYTLKAIGAYFGLHYSTVSKICRDSSQLDGRPGTDDDNRG